MIRKILLRNYRRFSELALDLSPQLNILVGANDTGKSTLIEAINLGLTGRVNGRPFSQEISPFFVNLHATKTYIDELHSAGDGPVPIPPAIIIELFFDDLDVEILHGTNNLTGESSCGVRLHAKLSAEYRQEYEDFVRAPDAVRLVPTEYYHVEWLGFSGNAISARSLPASAAVIEGGSIRLQSGVDYHLQKTIDRFLQPGERVELSRQYRSLREEFGQREHVRTINARLMEEPSTLTDRSLSIGIDLSQRYTWESTVSAQLDDLPMQFVGKGEQEAVKILLAIGRRADATHTILIEEPENHLGFASLRKLIRRIEERCEGKQLIIATHSNYVLNKLGLDHLILLGENGYARITDLDPGTVDYFKRLAGFDTLRMVLSNGAILVEGPSDELVVQRAYRDVKGRLPIEDGIDVISVGLSHKRFLQLAVRLRRRTWIVTDNDGRRPEEMLQRFAGFLQHEFITLHTSDDPELRTLEPNIVAVNDLRTLNEVLDAEHQSKDGVTAAMLADKTESALAIFQSKVQLVMPTYIAEAVGGAGG